MNDIQQELLFGLPTETTKDEAKLRYLIMMQGFTHRPKVKSDRPPGRPSRREGDPHNVEPPAQRFPSNPEQLISPAERVQLALIALADEARALRAILDAPALLHSHIAHAKRCVTQIEKVAKCAESFFALSRGKYMHRGTAGRLRQGART